jgi:hypothetical protein
VRSANAVERSTTAVERSSDAVCSTAVAAGHMDHRGRYCGPPEPKPKKYPPGANRSDDGRAMRAMLENKPLEYEPLRKALQGAMVKH